MLISGHLGIHPPGALGIGFFVHARGECIIGMGGDGITETLEEVGCLRLEEAGAERVVPLRGRIYANLLEAEAKGALPELLFVCCNPNQLAAFTGEVTRFLESLAERGRLRGPGDVQASMPILLILPNGVLFESAASDFRDQVNESLLSAPYSCSQSMDGDSPRDQLCPRRKIIGMPTPNRLTSFQGSRPPNSVKPEKS